MNRERAGGAAPADKSAYIAAMEKKLRRQEARASARDSIISLVSPLLLLLIWELLARSGILDVRFFSSPTIIAATLWKLTRSGELPMDVGVSLRRICVGFLMGAVPGTILGAVMGLSRTVRAAVNPIVAATYPIPKIAILPLILLVFGLGEMSKYFIVAIGSFYVLLINTMAGVGNIDRIYLDVAKNFNASRVNTWRTVALPGALPMIFAGIRVGWGVSLLLIVAAEFLGAKSGIGFLIWNSWDILAVDQMFVGLLVIAALGFVSFWLIDEIEKRVVPWRTQRPG